MRPAPGAHPEQLVATADTPLTVMMIGALPVDLNLVKGGVEAVILNLFRGFRDLPFLRVVHVAFTKEVSQPKEVQFAPNIVIHFLPFRVPVELVDYAINDGKLKEIISVEKPEVIHIQEITPHLLRFLRYSKERIVVTQHGIMREELKYASGTGQRLKCLFKAYVERSIFPLFKHVIFISKYNQDLYPPRPVHGVQIFNPVNPIFFETDDGSQLRPNTLVYVGVLSRRKNVKIVIEAIADLKQRGKEFTLHVIGGFKDAGYEREVLEVVRTRNLSENVIFHGWMKQEQIREIYRQCPVFVLPSLQETLPVSIGEAMALGKVVVASDVGAIREMFTDGTSGFLFRKNDRDDLERVLDALHQHPDLGQIGQRARQEAIEKFHPSLIARRTIEFYREVIGMKAKTEK